MVWPCFKVFWFSKDNPTGHSERNMKRGRQKKRWEDNIKEWTGIGFVISTRAAENRTRWKGNVTNSSVVPRRPSNVIRSIEYNSPGSAYSLLEITSQILWSISLESQCLNI